MDSVRIARGFSDDQRERVGSLYWEAFSRKLQPGFASQLRGLDVVRDALCPDHVLVALRHEVPVGVCGFYLAGSGAADFSWSRLRRQLSVSAALRAALVLSALSRTERPGSLLLDGICVDSMARGRGIGTALLNAVTNHARDLDLRTIRLSVIDTNARARALYARHGFRPVGSGTLGPLSRIYGFSSYTTMELKVDR